MAQTNLSIVLDAVDNASKQLGIAQKAIENLGKTSKTGSASMQSSFSGVMSSAKQLAAVFGIAFGGYQIVKFFKDSAQEAIKAQSEWNLVQNRIDAIGMSWKQTEGIVREFGMAMQNLGRDDEQVALGVSLLVAKTGDLSKAMEMTKAASDLASSGYNTMEDNVDAFSKILSGRGSFALRQFNIKLPETATIAEQLNAVMKKITRTTEEWAQTTEGQVAIMSMRWKELKEIVGSKVVPIFASVFYPVISEVIDKITDSTGQININSQELSKWSRVIYSTVFVFKGLIDTLILVSKIIATVAAVQIDAGKILTNFAKDVANNFKNLGKVLSIFSSAYHKLLILDFKGAKEEFANMPDFDFGDTTESIKKFASYTESELKMLENSWGIVKDDFSKAMNPPDISKVTSNIDKIITKAGSLPKVIVPKIETEGSEKSAEQLQNKLDDLADKYKEVKDKIVTTLEDLTAKHKDELKSITDDITSTRDKMAELLSSNVNTVQSARAEAATKLVEIESKIKDAEKEMASLLTPEGNLPEDRKRYDELQAYVVTEKQALESHDDWKRSLMGEYEKAINFSQLSEAEQVMTTAQEKIDSANKEYQDKLSKLQDELKAFQDQQSAEITSYNDKVTALKNLDIQANVMYQQFLSTRQGLTDNYLASETKKWADFSNLVARVGEGKIAVVPLTPAVTKVPKLAEGGIVSKPTLAMVGESGSEAIIPLDKKGSISNENIFNFDFTGAIISDIGYLKSEIIKTLNRTAELRAVSGQ